MEEFIVGLMALVALSIPFIFYGYLRRLRHRETLIMMERGLIRPVGEPARTPSDLRWGVMLTAFGLALSCGLWPLGFMMHVNAPLGLGPWLLPGFLLGATGLGLLLLHRIANQGNGEAPTWPESPASPPPASAGQEAMDGDL